MSFTVHTGAVRRDAIAGVLGPVRRFGERLVGGRRRAHCLLNRGDPLRKGRNIAALPPSRTIRATMTG